MGGELLFWGLPGRMFHCSTPVASFTGDPLMLEGVKKNFCVVVHIVCVRFFLVNKNTGRLVNLLRNKTNKETCNCTVFQVQYVTCKRLKAVELDARATAWQSGFRTGSLCESGFGEGWGKVGCFQIGHLGFGVVEKDSGWRYSRCLDVKIM